MKVSSVWTLADGTEITLSKTLNPRDVSAFGCKCPDRDDWDQQKECECNIAYKLTLGQYDFFDQLTRSVFKLLVDKVNLVKQELTVLEEEK